MTNKVVAKPVVLETPFAGNVEANIRYARKCMHDMLQRGEAPYASHLLYTQDGVLDDTIPEERTLGIEAGFAWKHIPGVHTVFYLDKGMSAGMELALAYITEHRMSYEFRRFDGEAVARTTVFSDPREVL